MRPIWSYAGLPRPFETLVVKVMSTCNHLQEYLALGQAYHAVYMVGDWPIGAYRELTIFVVKSSLPMSFCSLGTSQVTTKLDVLPCHYQLAQSHSHCRSLTPGLMRAPLTKASSSVVQATSG
jgi:hypothetical protein